MAVTQLAENQQGGVAKWQRLIAWSDAFCKKNLVVFLISGVNKNSPNT